MLKNCCLTQFVDLSLRIISTFNLFKTIRIKTSKGMKFYSFNDVKEVVEKDGTIIWSYKAYNLREEQRRRNTCLYGIAGIAVIYFLIIDNLLEDFTMDPND